jgi:hypothetical protein
MSIIDGVEFKENDSFDYESESKPIKFVDSNKDTNINKTHVESSKKTLVNNINLPNNNDESMTDWLVNKGLVGTHSTAKKVLIFVIIINFLITILAFIS